MNWLVCLFKDCGGSHASDLARAVPEISPDGLFGAVVVVVGLLAMTTKGRKHP